MSLLRLLTTGKTLVGVEDVKTRYRVNRQGTLPRFGSAKNPFRATDKLEPGRVDTRSENEETLVPSRQKPAEIGAWLPAPDLSAAAVSPKRTASLSSNAFGLAVVLRQKMATFWSGCRRRLSPLFSHPRGKPVRAGVLQAPKLAMQGELSLNKIKVVRNDLTDTDLEIARVKPPATQAANAPSSRVAEKGEPGGASWGRLAARVFGAGKM